MKFVIRTVEGGKRIPLDRVTEKKRAAVEKIMAAGFDYLEVQGILGTRDAQGNRIEEPVIIIEASTGEVYV